MTTSVQEILDTRAEIKRLNHSRDKDTIRVSIAGGVLAIISILLWIPFHKYLGEQSVYIFVMPLFVVGICLLVGGVIWDNSLGRCVKRIQKGAVASLEALEQNLPQMLKSYRYGSQGYVSDLAHRLLSKWLKENHPDGNHPHLRSLIHELRLGMALLALHSPKNCEIGEDGLLSGMFRHENVREGMGGLCEVTWKLEPGGNFSIRLRHYANGSFTDTVI